MCSYMASTSIIMYVAIMCKVTYLMRGCSYEGKGGNRPPPRTKFAITKADRSDLAKE